MQTVAKINYDLPDDLHRRAKSAAALQGVSLKQFLIDALEMATRQAETGTKRRGR